MNYLKQKLLSELKKKKDKIPLLDMTDYVTIEGSPLYDAMKSSGAEVVKLQAENGEEAMQLMHELYDLVGGSNMSNCCFWSPSSLKDKVVSWGRSKERILGHVFGGERNASVDFDGGSFDNIQAMLSTSYAKPLGEERIQLLLSPTVPVTELLSKKVSPKVTLVILPHDFDILTGEIAASTGNAGDGLMVTNLHVPGMQIRIIASGKMREVENNTTSAGSVVLKGMLEPQPVGSNLVRKLCASVGFTPDSNEYVIVAGSGSFKVGPVAPTKAVLMTIPTRTVLVRDISDKKLTLLQPLMPTANGRIKDEKLDFLSEIMSNVAAALHGSHEAAVEILKDLRILKDEDAMEGINATSDVIFDSIVKGLVRGMAFDGEMASRMTKLAGAYIKRKTQVNGMFVHVIGSDAIDADTIAIPRNWAKALSAKVGYAAIEDGTMVHVFRHPIISNAGYRRLKVALHDNGPYVIGNATIIKTCFQGDYDGDKLGIIPEGESWLTFSESGNAAAPEIEAKKGRKAPAMISASSDKEWVEITRAYFDGCEVASLTGQAYNRLMAITIMLDYGKNLTDSGKLYWSKQASLTRGVYQAALEARKHEAKNLSLPKHPYGKNQQAEVVLSVCSTAFSMWSKLVTDGDVIAFASIGYNAKESFGKGRLWDRSYYDLKAGLLPFTNESRELAKQLWHDLANLGVAGRFATRAINRLIPSNKPAAIKQIGDSLAIKPDMPVWQRNIRVTGEYSNDMLRPHVKIGDTRASELAETATVRMQNLCKRHNLVIKDVLRLVARNVGHKLVLHRQFGNTVYVRHNDDVDVFNLADVYAAGLVSKAIYRDGYWVADVTLSDNSTATMISMHTMSLEKAAELDELAGFISLLEGIRSYNDLVAFGNLNGDERAVTAALDYLDREVNRVALVLAMNTGDLRTGEKHASELLLTAWGAVQATFGAIITEWGYYSNKQRVTVGDYTHCLTMAPRYLYLTLDVEVALSLGLAVNLPKVETLSDVPLIVL